MHSAPLASTPVWARDFNSSEELITEFCRECRIVRKGNCFLFCFSFWNLLHYFGLKKSGIAHCMSSEDLATFSSMERYMPIGF